MSSKSMLSLTVVVGLEEVFRVVGCDVGVRVVGVDDVSLDVYGSVVWNKF
jgi:hypothetical protein